MEVKSIPAKRVSEWSLVISTLTSLVVRDDCRPNETVCCVRACSASLKPREALAVHFRHADIRDHQIEVFSLREGQSFFSRNAISAESSITKAWDFDCRSDFSSCDPLFEMIASHIESLLRIADKLR